ncbi:MAG: MFS transporter, partial [Myxococcota bacterium]
MRHALAYGSFFSAVGLLSTYMPVHLQRFGLTAATIGTLFGVRTAIATASQLLLTPRLPPHRVGWALVLSAAWAAAFGLGVALASDAVWLMALILVIAPGQALAIPLLDTVVIDQLGADRFGAVRRWGSIGYGVTVGAVAWWAQGRSYAEVGRLAAMGFAVMLALTLVQMVFVARPSAGTATQADGSTTGSVPRDPALVGFFLINGLHWIGGAQFNVFISLHAQRLGLDPSVPGAAIAAMIVGEVLAMSAVGRLLPHWGL